MSENISEASKVGRIKGMLNGEPSERRLKVLVLLGCIPGIGLIALGLMARDMAKLDERIARRYP